MKKLIKFLKKYWWLVLILAVFGFQWNASNDGLRVSEQDAYLEYENSYAEAAYMDNSYDKSFSGEGFSLMSVTDESYEQKIMKSGSLSLHMHDVREAVESMTEYVEGISGLVSSSSVSKYGNSYTAYLTLRVPAESFNETVAALKEMSVYVDYEYTNADDITETYMDLEARLNNLEAEEAAYLEVMEKAYSVEDILNVTSYLSNVRYEIESIESSLSYYDARVDYSTIDLTLTEDESFTSATQNWKPVSTVREAFSDWIEFLQFGVDQVIYGFIYLWPLALFVLFVWLVKRRRR